MTPPAGVCSVYLTPVRHILRRRRLQVYALDWSPDGQRVASGGKDKVLKM